MFSGIIMNLGEICGFDEKKSLLSIKSEIKDVSLGDSISCSGVCLTVSEINKNILNFHLSSETIQKTNLLKYKTGDLINIEKSLKVGDEINGHFVFGHVDGLSQVKKIKKLSDSWVFELSTDNDIMRFLSPKCSISLDGISLTVNNVLENSFSLSIIPYTWENTSLKNSLEGDYLNTEIDMLARYVFRAMNK